jgi:hypothetical protein
MRKIMLAVLMVTLCITYTASASTEAIKTTCEVVITYKNSLLGLLPIRHTGEVKLEGVNMKNISVTDTNQLFTFTMPKDYMTKFENETFSKGAESVKLICPLKDGEFKIEIRKH